MVQLKGEKYNTMITTVGEFAVRYSEDLAQIIIACTSLSSWLSTHVALCNRLQGIAKPTGQYSRLTFNNQVYLGVHFENTIPKECLMQALSQ